MIPPDLKPIFRINEIKGFSILNVKLFEICYPKKSC
jgi:hypothetical protein